MKCKLVENNLIGFVEGKLTSILTSAIEEHLLDCKKCSALLNEVKATYIVCEHSVIPSVNPYFYTRLEQKLITKKANKVFRIQIAPRIWQPIAACIMIVISVSIGFSIGKQVPISATTNNAVTKGDNLNTYASEYYSDGSVEESLDNLITNQ